MKLASMMQIDSFADILGQDELTKDGSLFRKIVANGGFDSLIFTGPPGSGKTIVSKLIGKLLDNELISLHATTHGVTDLKKIVANISISDKGNVILFIDEIHRYTKSQQDFLLKLLDDKEVKIIGASTENPYFNLTPAFRSRSLMFKFKALERKSLEEIANKAKKHISEIMGIRYIDFNDNLDYFIDMCNGDTRRFLNIIELASMIGDRRDDTLYLSKEGLEEVVAKNSFSEDENCDLFSAMIKSIRGTDPDAAILWAMKLYNSGVPPEAIYRRLMVSASEDIGNAYPEAVTFINASYNNFMNVGVPEGLIIFSHAVIYLASLPKSNRCYLAYHKTSSYLKDINPSVPSNIRYSNSSYKYPFDYGEFVDQNYIEDNRSKDKSSRSKNGDNDLSFYLPSEIGFESKISERLKRLWKSRVGRYGQSND